MSDVFISYSHKDELFARQLGEALSKAGIDVWIDVDDIPVGMKWSTAVQKGLALCEVMIVIITPDSMASRNVEDEWQYYLDQGKPVVPVLRKPASIHFQLNRIQRIDFYAQPYNEALQYLFLELESLGIKLKPGTITTRPQGTIGRRPEALTVAARPKTSSPGRRVLQVFGLLLLLIVVSTGTFALLTNLNRGGSGQVSGQTTTAVAQAALTSTADTLSATQEVEASAVAAIPTSTEEIVVITEAAAETEAVVPPPTEEPSATEEAQPTAASPTPEGVTLTANEAVNVRRGDDPAFGMVFTLRRGEQAQVLGKNRFSRWYFIEFTDSTGQTQRGWVFEGFVTLTGDEASLPTLNMDSANALP